MIKIDNNKAIMEFGFGDIGFNAYERVDAEEVGLIFYNQEPRQIGSVADKKADTYVNPLDFPVQMIFRKAESVDTLIEALVELRGMFNDSPLDIGHHFECDVCGDIFDVDEINLTDDAYELCHSCFDDLTFFLKEAEIHNSNLHE